MGWRIFHHAGLAFRCRSRLNSNVRLRINQMLCRCYRRPSAPVKRVASAEPTPVLSAWSPSGEFMKAPSAPAALTSGGVRSVACSSLLVELRAMAFDYRFHVPSAHCVRMAGAPGHRNTEDATPAHPNSSRLKGPRPYSWLKPALRPTATQIRHSTVRRAEPNPSFKPSPNGGSRWPSSAGPAAHFALAVQHAPPSVPA